MLIKTFMRIRRKEFYYNLKMLYSLSALLVKNLLYKNDLNKAPCAKYIMLIRQLKYYAASVIFTVEHLYKNNN